MKIEAKKSKLSLNQNQPSRPGKKPARESKRAREELYAEKPKSKPPATKEPESRVPKIKLPRIKLPTLSVPKFKGNRSLYLIVLLVGVPALMVSIWLGMNLRKHPVPGPLFTESNLPPSPPADANGCLLVYDNQLYNEYFSRDLSDINLLRNAASMERFLDKTTGEYTVAKNLAGRDDVKKMMGVYRDIMKKPVFADTVMPGPQDAQKYRVYVALHNSITAVMVSRIQEKKYAAAFKLMKDQLNLNIQYIGSARSMINYITAMQAYEKSLGILKSMLNQFNAGRKMGNDSLAACREIGELVRSFNPQGASLAPIVMFEYIAVWKQTFNPLIQHPEAAIRQIMKRKPLVFFDRGLTQQMFDDRWKKLYEYAKKPDDTTLAEVRKLQEQRYTAARFWWLHNAVGKKYLDSITITAFQLFQESKNWTTAISRNQGEVVNILNALKEEPEQERKQEKKPIKKPARKPRKNR